MNVAVVVNPVGAAEPGQVVREVFAKRGIEPAWYETTEDDPGLGQSREALESGCDLIVAVGGDGTVRACAEGLASSDATLAIVPAGTGNLLAGNLEVPEDAEEAAELALEGETTVLDVGAVNDEIFCVIAGAGIDAVIMEETTRESKDRLGVLAYVIEGAKHVFDDSIHASISVDGGEGVGGRWATIMVGNLGRLQGGVDIFPDSKPNDGLLDVLALSADSPFENLSAAFQLVAAEGDRIARAQASTVRLEFEKPTPYQLDGEPRDAARVLEFEARPRALRVRIGGER